MLANDVVTLAAERGVTIACAESVTGGLVCARLTAVPGASPVVAGGVVVYTVETKVAVLGVDRQLIDRHGVVSEEVALAMARRARELFSADIGVATTGAAGPEPHGGKVPGTICVGSVGPAGEFATTAVHSGDREAVCGAAVTDAMAALALALGETRGEQVTGQEHT